MKKKILFGSLLSALLSVVTISAQQITVTYDNVPEFMEEDGSFSPGDHLIFTLDNIPDGNTGTAPGPRANVRIVLDGNAAGGPNLVQSVMNLADGIPDGPPPGSIFPTGTAYTLTSTTPGTMAGTFRRTYDYSRIAGAGGASFPLGDNVVFATVRVVADPSGMNVDHPATTGNVGNITVVTDVLSVSDINKADISSSIYPNPVNSGEIINVDVEGVATYVIIDMAGSTILEQDATGTIDTSALAIGIYFLVTEAGVSKIVVR